MSDFLMKLKNNLLAYYKDIVVGFIILSLSWVLLMRFFPPPITLLMITRCVTDEGKFQYDWVNYNDISPYIKVCAIASEDQALPFHYGLDIEAIGKAVNLNKKSKKTFGASTITQQVAKNVFLFPQRSYFRKVLELYFSFLLETIWSKERIMETYLNVAEMGTLTFGVEAAAQEYYNKSASKLSLSEAATIIAVLPSPRKYSVKNPGSYVAQRRQEIVSLFYSLDGTNYLRELYVKSDKSLYDFSKYKK
ncbi:MAG: monofunctional biosynthetic peptidoglycan transglycosylase [Saprospiraceae bacterium]|nr:monofunctional biosynthetic peptidoglycan transglycosylase [Saprospiraceae bacterium]